MSFSVFGMLLGDTIILDTLDHANSYRQEVSLCILYLCFTPNDVEDRRRTDRFLKTNLVDCR